MWFLQNVRKPLALPYKNKIAHMNALDFCQNFKNLIFGTFWALLTRWNFFSKIAVRHVPYFKTI